MVDGQESSSMEPSSVPTFLLPYRLEDDERRRLEECIPSLTYDIHEARVVLGRVSADRKAKYELQRLGLLTTPVPLGSRDGVDESNEGSPESKSSLSSHHDPRRRPRCQGPGNAIERGGIVTAQHSRPSSPRTGDLVEVVKLEWLTDTTERGELLPLEKYIVYRGLVIRPDKRFVPRSQAKVARPDDVRARAIGDGIETLQTSQQDEALPQTMLQRRSGMIGHRPALLAQTTSEHDAVTGLPEMPAYLTNIYSCQRPTPANTPNDGFITILRSIRKTRKLLNDVTGERAYSTAIASIAAYPYPITSEIELERLPGCGDKIVRIYREWLVSGTYGDKDATSTRSEMEVLALFYEIWGVGATTAKKFYRMGWSSLDDVVQYGWDDLSRVQQIGVKYYEEFLIPIPRAEVKQIGDIILRHARVVDPGFQMLIVGGFRRGKEKSGDVDVVISHQIENATLHFVSKLVVSLEKSGYITHTLTMSLNNSQRGQRPVSWKGGGGSGTGFDTLDKALVVWRDQDAAEAQVATGPVGEPPKKLHRRVDIIISPWKTVGCAVLGWSGGTTFQRDLRWYCKNVLNLKFDSSGIRSRADGSWVDLEGGEAGPAPDMVSAEKRVFQGLSLEWRRPEERCTD